MGGLPRAAGVFTGRDGELDALLGMLDRDGPGGRLLVIDNAADLDARLHSLQVLDAAPAAALISDVIALRRGPGDARLHDPAHGTGLSELARSCEGLPLALRIIAALLADRPHLTPAALAKSMLNEHGRLDDLDKLKRGETSSDLAVHAAFDLSYRHLSPAQARMFRLLPTNPGPTIATVAAAHLVEEPSPGRWRQHDLLRLHATAQTPDHVGEAETAHRRLITYYLLTTYDANTHLDIPAKAPVEGAFSDRNAALAWLDAEHLNITAATLHAAATADHDTATRLVFGLTRYLHWRRRFNEAITLANLAITAARTLGDRDGGAQALSGLGLALREVRRFAKARQCWVEALEAFTETGDDMRATRVRDLLASLDGREQ